MGIPMPLDCFCFVVGSGDGEEKGNPRLVNRPHVTHTQRTLTNKL
jgi:hypothetical protein